MYASKDVWKSAFPLLKKKNADVVLMDLRRFTMQHEGCISELEHLRNHRKLRQVAFLIDPHIPRPELETLLDECEIEVLDYERRPHDERHALFDYY